MPSKKSNTPSTACVAFRLPKPWVYALQFMADTHGIRLAELMRHIFELGLDVGPGDLEAGPVGSARMERIREAVWGAVGRQQALLAGAEYVTAAAKKASLQRDAKRPKGPIRSRLSDELIAKRVAREILSAQGEEAAKLVREHGGPSVDAAPNAPSHPRAR